MYSLSVRASDGSRFHRELDQPALRVGRSANNDLVLADPCVSRVHFELIRQADGWTLRDLGSKAGTMVNSAPVREPVSLRPGDIITAGRTNILFESSSVPAGLGLEPPVSTIDTTPVPDRLGTEPQERTPTEGLVGSVFRLDQEPTLGRPVGEILEKVMDLAGKAVPFDRGAMMILDETGELVPVVRRPAGHRPPSGYLTQAVTRQVIAKQEAVLLPDAFGGDLPGLDPGTGSEIRSTLCVPFWSNQRLAGVIYLDSRDPAVRYGYRHLEKMAYLAGIVGARMESARLFEQLVRQQQKLRDIHEAAKIQQHLLPEGAPAIPGYRLDGSSFPCEEIGGDFYDFVPLQDGRWGITVADVAGHGLPAAILMSRFQAILSVLWESGGPLEQMVERLNQLLCRRMPENRYLTLFCAVLDPCRHSLTYVNAGHPSAWLLSPDGPDTPLPITGLFLGSFPEVRLRAGTAPMGPESILICPSDGITEARNELGEMFGEARLIAAARRRFGGSPGDIITHLATEVDLHRSGTPQLDDMTLVVLAREGGRADTGAPA